LNLLSAALPIIKQARCNFLRDAIMLQDVTQVHKKKHYGFPNSVEIVWRGKRDVFTSFLKRDNAYRILTFVWSKST